MKAGSQIDFYREFYNLPELDYRETVPCKVFQTLRKNHSFCIIGIFNEKNEFIIIKNLNKNIGWELPGGYIEEGERIEDAINRITDTETGLKIDSLEPIALSKNIFEHDGQEVTHTGIVFAAAARGEPKRIPFNTILSYVREAPKMAYQNEAIFNLLASSLKKAKDPLPYHEIESANEIGFRQWINKHVIGPLGRSASRKIKKKIFDLAEGNPDSILDASCGDSSLILSLQKYFHARIAVGNDICWDTLSLIKEKSPYVFFTNHDARNLPFQKSFDLLIFKNTLHHLPSEQQEGSLVQFGKMAKNLIIVDICNPRKGNFLARLWNAYYVRFLDDQGHFFLDEQSFAALMRKAFPGRTIKNGIIKTIKGNYLYSSVA